MLPLLFLSFYGHLITGWTVLLLSFVQGEELSLINQITSTARTFCFSISSTWSKGFIFMPIKHRQYSFVSKGRLLFPFIYSFRKFQSICMVSLWKTILGESWLTIFMVHFRFIFIFCMMNKATFTLGYLFPFDSYW